jgi:hypothetical protein
LIDMTKPACPTAQHYREIAGEIRKVETRSCSSEIRGELSKLVARYERLASDLVRPHARARRRNPSQGRDIEAVEPEIVR